MAYTNYEGLPLSISVFLATEHYNKASDAISATQLLKATRKLILEHRMEEQETNTELVALVPSRTGTAIHDSIRTAWDDPSKALLALGYPAKTVEKFRVNPTDEEAATPGIIPVYTEQRFEREIDGYIVSGEPDFILQGQLTDFKNTSTFSHNNKEKNQDYIGQGSIYRWLRPDLITKDTIEIVHIFGDWTKGKSLQDSNYPKSRIHCFQLPLMPLTTTERFIKTKIKELVHYMDEDEKNLPLCSDKELWRKETVWKYYKNPANKSRSTKNYPNADLANKHLAEDGNIGEVVEVKGKAVACNYCSAFPICSQAKELASQGLLQT